MKRIKGTTLALIGLFFGLSLGCGVVALKYYLVQEIVDSLDDEVEAACDCKLVFDSFSLADPIGSHTTVTRHARPGHEKLVGTA